MSDPIWSRRWTDTDDRVLVFYGRRVGHDCVATRYLNRTAAEASRRMAWLAKNKPALVKELEDEADKEPEI